MIERKGLRWVGHEVKMSKNRKAMHILEARAGRKENWKITWDK